MGSIFSGWLTRTDNDKCLDETVDRQLQVRENSDNCETQAEFYKNRSDVLQKKLDLEISRVEVQKEIVKKEQLEAKYKLEAEKLAANFKLEAAKLEVKYKLEATPEGRQLDLEMEREKSKQLEVERELEIEKEKTKQIEKIEEETTKRMQLKKEAIAYIYPAPQHTESNTEASSNQVALSK